ncbi:MAG: AAA domain-containing protein [Candidatus Kariarchaeaceae archaeon]|jgi:DNA replication ATP-dependent helicase Dna2
MGQLFLVRSISDNQLECSDFQGIINKFEVRSPWLQFLTHLSIYDSVYIEHTDNIVDEHGALTIEPHYLVAVTRAVDALSCPRKIYVKMMGADEIIDQFQLKRMTQGNLLHSVFSQRVASGKTVEEAIQTVLDQSELELLTADMSHTDALTYLNRDAGIMGGLPISGQTEIDCQHWIYGLHGKFDALSNTNIIELKTSNIPDAKPWPNHNLQMTSYVKMMELRGKYKGTVLYLRDGQMGMKHPTPWNHNKTLITRNYAYLVLSGKFAPPVLRGEKSRECRRCFVKNGCKSLCAGLEAQRDCEDCYQRDICDQLSWNSISQNYFNRLTRALLEEEIEENREQFLFSRVGTSDNQIKTTLLDRGFTCITKKKISQSHKKGMFIASFEQVSKMSRFRRGDMARAYNMQTTHDQVTLFFSVIITDFTRDSISLESINELPESLYIVPSSYSSSPRTGRRALYRATLSSSKLISILRQSLVSTLKLDKIETKPIKLHKPLQDYNSSQIKAIRYALCTEDILLIQGPAGTGKTSVIVELIHQFHLSGKSILCSAYTNMAVDNVGKMLKEVGIPFIRLGNLHSMDPELHEYSALAQADMFKEVVEKKTASIVLATTSTIARSNYEDFWFDYVLLDEAAQMTEPDALKALLLGQRAIMVGDHAQLQPIIISDNAQKMGLQISLFERLVQALPERYMLLTEQYRMNDEILKFPNLKFYEGLLRSANDKIGNQTLPKFTGSFVDDKPYEIISVMDEEHNRAQQVNHSEAAVILAIMKDLLTQNPQLNDDDIGIITPFRAQVAHLRALLPGFHIDTVDRFQGSEREVILYSTITMQDIPILTDPRRLNVALTRAKKKLIVLVSNPSITRKLSLFDLVYHDAMERNIVRTINFQQLKKLKDVKALKSNQEGILQFVTDSYPLIEIDLFKDYDDKFATSLGSHVNIFFKSIQLTLNTVDSEVICSICLQSVEIGIQCLGCAYWFHEDHLRMWIHEQHFCPVCKNTLRIMN